MTHVDPTEPWWLAGELARCVFVFDFPAFLHRAMHACYGKNVRTVPKTDTTCARQALLMFANVVDRLRVRRMLVVVDGICDQLDEWAMSNQPLLRCDYYPAYKSARALQPDVFRHQAPALYQRLATDLGLIVLCQERYEADDIIGSIVRVRATPLCIVTSDKDMAQYIALGPNHVVLFDPTAKTNAFMSHAECMHKFGVEPAQIPDYIGLVGDPSDNIPGVPKIGAKTAAKLVTEFGSLDHLYEDTNRLQLATKPGQFTSLMEHRDTAFLSRQLAQPIFTPHVTLTYYPPDGLVDPLRSPPGSAIREAARRWYP